MSFRHYTKLKEIAEKYGCDSTGCNTNGALLDRIYESEVTPVEPTGPINGTIFVENITLKKVRPVEGHSYLGVTTIPSDTWLLEFENVVGRVDRTGSQPVFYIPIGTTFGSVGDINCSVIINDVENNSYGNMMLAKGQVGNPPTGFTDEQIQTLKTEIEKGVLILNSQYGKYTFTEIIDG